MRIFVILAVLLVAGPASADTWQLDYLVRGSVGQATHFYAPGSYEFLLTPTSVPVYIFDTPTRFLGFYGDVALPADLPPITFPTGFDQIVAFRVTTPVVSVPERAIIPRFHRMLRFGFGWGLEATLTRQLQRMTTWLAAAVLRAPHSATEIYLPTVTLSVGENCSGLQTLALMLVAAGLIVAVRRRTLVFCGMIGLAAIVFALEANASRVVLIALGGVHRDWIQTATTGFALAQLVGLGRLVARS